MNLEQHWNNGSVRFRYLYYRVRSELKTHSEENYLGYLWWIIEPCLMITVFYVVFGVLLQRGGAGFASSLLLGVTAWLWFAGSLIRGMGSVQRESNLMQQIYVPKYVFPLASLLFSLVKQLVVVTLLLGLLVFVNGAEASWVFFPMVFLVQLLLIAGLCMMLAALVPFLPDITMIVPPLLQMGLFCSGVFYRIESLPTQYQGLFRLNPMAGLIEEYRNVILHGLAPDFAYLGAVVLVSTILVSIGSALLVRHDKRYPRLV